MTILDKYGSTECKCGLAVMGTLARFGALKTACYSSEKAMEIQLNKMKQSVNDMGKDCKINVDEPLRFLTEFHGIMDSIGHREKPEEGINYREKDLWDFFDTINNTIYNSLNECISEKLL